MRFNWAIQGAVLAIVTAILTQEANAQTKMRTGMLLLNQTRELATRSTTLSSGVLADLPTDPNFAGDLQTIVNDAAVILSNYTVVNRGGYFPENQGIPREQQLTPLEVIYHIYSLPNGNELFLYRTPTLDTSEYFIRKAS